MRGKNEFVCDITEGVYEVESGDWINKNKFWCPGCKVVVFSMDKTPPVCRWCSAQSETFISDGANIGGCDYDTPIVSDSLAVSMNQIDEHKQAFPGIEITPQGQPVFHNRREHDKYLDQINMVKQPKKIKNLGKETL